MSDDFKDKLRSIQFAGKKAGAKVVTDVHDHHTVTVTTHDERQDVTVKAPAIRLSQGETSG